VSSGGGSGRNEKRSRVGSVSVGGRSRLGMASGTSGDVDVGNMDGDRDTPGLSAPGSSSSEDSSSDLTSPSPPPQVDPAPSVASSSAPPESLSTHPQIKSPKSKVGKNSSYSTQDNNDGGSIKSLTRRQRKALGLPKRLALSSGAGKIIIPGGKWKGPQSVGVGVVVDGDGDEEWRRNGTGRVDVRGFRELKI
jgi:OTU domain-containing protein 3